MITESIVYLQNDSNLIYSMWFISEFYLPVLLLFQFNKFKLSRARPAIFNGP